MIGSACSRGLCYPGEDALAQKIAGELDGYLSSKLFGALGMRLSLSDAGQENNGGDESLNIYLVQALPARTRARPPVRRHRIL
ncbi:MAG: hypothetical protein ACREYC_16590 [Gammaproteobacteria bacterium]